MVSITEMVSTTESGRREVPVSSAPSIYKGFDGQYIDGSWRPGKTRRCASRH